MCISGPKVLTILSRYSFKTEGKSLSRLHFIVEQFGHSSSTFRVKYGEEKESDFSGSTSDPESRKSYRSLTIVEGPMTQKLESRYGEMSSLYINVELFELCVKEER